MLLFHDRTLIFDSFVVDQTHGPETNHELDIDQFLVALVNFAEFIGNEN